MRNIFLLLIFIFPNTNQLLCFRPCTSIILNSLEPFREPSDVYKRLNDTQAINCYGQLMTYYEGRGNLKYISYSLGPRTHVIEKEIEELLNKNNFKAIIYFLFLIESFDTDEVVISTYIICQTGDNCALNYIRDLINAHHKKLNPINQLSPLLYNSNGVTELFCYNSETKQAEKCPLYQRPTCIINNTDRIEQECYSDSNTKLEYVFMITSSEQNSMKKILELIICNRYGCNEESKLKEVEAIVYNYTLYGLNMTFNRSHRLKFYFIYLLIFKHMF